MREYRTPGSVRGRSGNWPSYLDSLAEFTNANFLSQDTTINAYPNPDLLALIDDEGEILIHVAGVVGEDGIRDNVKYVLHPVEGYRLATTSFLPSNRNLVILSEDDNVWQDYAAYLIPRAVGYSTALLNYFFRGNFSVSQAFPERNDEGEITGLELKAKNDSKLDEESEEIEPFGPGNIALCCKYIPPGAKEPVYTLVEDVYTLHNAGDAINSDYVSIHANFATPIPPKVKDLSFTLVFRGELGQEADAVAARAFKFTSRIAYQYQPGGRGATSNIYTIRPDGTDERNITKAEEPNPFYYKPEWSPDGRLLAFNRESCTDLDAQGFCSTEGFDRPIWVTDFFSKESLPYNLKRILDVGESRICESPEEIQMHGFSFSPDSSRVVALVTNYLFSGLVVFDVSDGNWKFIDGEVLIDSVFGIWGPIEGFDYWVHHRPGHHMFGSAPAWSPRGDEIAFYTGEGERDVEGACSKGDIFLINPDGGRAIQLTNDERLSTQPAWAPDGEQILFVSDRDGGDIWDIWIMDRTGDNKRKILDCDSNCYSPCSSPDGQTIAFIKDHDIYTVNMDGQDLHRVTTGEGKSAPAWSQWIFEASVP